jgi:signal transduction histidine kinase
MTPAGDEDHLRALNDSARLEALRNSNLMDSPPEERYDRLTRLAARALRCPVALLSLVDNHRQFFKSCVGLPEPFATGRQTPLSGSICQYAVSTGKPLIIDDARTHPLVADNKAITELGVIAYAGIPVLGADGATLGSFCVIDTEPRQWQADEIAMLSDLAASVMTEISLTQAKEAAESANRAKDRFLAVLSHELRTPLSPALMLAEEIEHNRDVGEEVRQSAATIRRNIEMQTSLIDDLLDVTRIENGKLALRRESVDLHAVIAESIRQLRPDAEAKRITLHLRLRAMRTALMGDPWRLQQVVMNLLKNSIKFTPAGGKILIGTTNVAADRVAVAVSDTGLGIAPPLLAELFEPFQQGGRQMTRQFGGLGLGLAICRGIVESHGGTIRAASDGKGRGATITFELPLAPSALPAPAPTAPFKPRPGARLNILLVEDHEDTLKAMARLLRRLNHEVTTAATVEEARSAADAGIFDLLISDVGLPDGTGLQLMQDLLSSRPIKGIALTGYGSEADVEKTLQAGFSSHLTKPINFPDLEAAIMRVAESMGG